jgi:hypothetical protein
MLRAAVPCRACRAWRPAFVALGHRPAATPSSAAAARLASSAAAAAARATPPAAALAAPPAAVATLRALGVRGVVEWARALGVEPAEAARLGRQRVDGDALLDLTSPQLAARCRLRGGPAAAIARAVAAARGQLPPDAVVTLRLHPPWGARRNNAIEVTLTRAVFDAHYAPLALVTNDGAHVRDVTTLEQALEASAYAGARLCRSVVLEDRVTTLEGNDANAAAGLEEQTTRALAADSALGAALGGPLTPVNGGASVVFFSVDAATGAKAAVLQTDGLVAGVRTVLLNGVKQTPTLKHVDTLVADGRKLRGLLAAPASFVTEPVGAKAELLRVGHSADGARAPEVVLVQSGYLFRADIEAACAARSVLTMRPDGDGFAVVGLHGAPPVGPRA